MPAEFPEIKTHRLLLRRFTPDDLEKVYLGLSHPEVIRYYGVRYSSLDETQAQMKFFDDLEKNETGLWWAICSEDHATFYGAAGLNNLVKPHRKAELGFWLLPQHWGKGIIREVLPLICDYAFNKMGLHRIEAVVETQNHRSKKVLQQMNFSHEGTMVECEWKNNGFIDLDLFALLNKS